MLLLGVGDGIAWQGTKPLAGQIRRAVDVVERLHDCSLAVTNDARGNGLNSVVPCGTLETFLAHSSFVFGLILLFILPTTILGRCRSTSVAAILAAAVVVGRAAIGAVLAGYGGFLDDTA